MCQLLLTRKWLLEEKLNSSKVLAKSLLRVKMVMFRNTKSLAFLLQILYGDLNLSKNQKCGVSKSPSAHCYIRDGDLHYILCFLGDIGCSKRNYDKMRRLRLRFFRSTNTYFWWCLRNWEVRYKDLYRDIIWHAVQHKVCVCVSHIH